MARRFQSTQHRHRVVAHQGINAHQSEVLLNSLGDQQTIKRVFVRRRQLIQSPDVWPLHGQQQPTFLFNDPAMNLWQRQVEIQLAQLHFDLDLPEVDHAAADLMVRICDAAESSGGQAGGFSQPPDQHTRIEKKPGAAQGIRNFSAREASKSAWVCILPSRPPGCRGAEAVGEVESCMAANRAPTWLRCSGDRRSSCCCSDGLMEVMANRRNATFDPRWVEPASPPAPEPSSLQQVNCEARGRLGTAGRVRFTSSKEVH